MSGDAPTALREVGLPWLGPVPACWSVQRLSSVARLESGHTPSRQRPEYWEHCTIPWFSLADVWQIRDAGRMHVTDTAECISELGMANSAARLLPAGTVILSRTASVGFAGVLARPMATTQDFVNWVCGHALIPEYLCYVFQAMRPEFQRLMAGSTHKTIYMPSVRALRVPVPPVDEQRAIMTLLDRTAAACAKASREAAALADLLVARRRAAIDAAVVGPAAASPGRSALPDGWRWARVKEVVPHLEQGWSPECEARPAREGEWGVLKAGAVNGGVFRQAEHKALPSTLAPEPQLEVREGDVLMSRANTRALVGSVGIVPACRPRLLLCDKLYRLQFDSRSIDPRYLVYVLASSATRMQVERIASGSSSSMVNIGQSDVRGLRLPLPGLEEQRRIVERLDVDLTRLDSLQREASRQAELLAEHRVALVREAVAGRLASVRGVPTTAPARLPLHTLPELATCP